MSDSKLPIDSKYISAGLAALGMVALAVSGFINITTPAEQECNNELTEIKVSAAKLETRVELLEETKVACKVALEGLTESSP